MTRLTENFTLEELTVSPAARRLGIPNNPGPEEIKNLRHVCENILEKVRAHFGRPVKVNSGYRSPRVNAAVRGSATSQHRFGEAVDFEIPGVANKDIADWIGDNLEFDQIILEFYNPREGPSSGWVHVSLRRNGKNRRQRMIAEKSSRGTVYKQTADFNPRTSMSLRAPVVSPTTRPQSPVTLLQRKVGVVTDGIIGPKTIAAAMKYFKLTEVRAAHFFGQCAHETQNFTKFTENMNYSASGLLSAFPGYFTPYTAAKNERDPEAIANIVYSGRNGNTKDGDGWKFIGRGGIHLSGRDNYVEFANSISRQDIIDNPELVATEFAFESAIFFFNKNKLWGICDAGVNDLAITALTRKINGGTKGLAERKQLTKRMYSIIKEI